MSTGSALLDMYLGSHGQEKTAALEKTAEEIRLEKIGSVAQAEFNRALENYLFDFALTDLSR